MKTQELKKLNSRTLLSKMENLTGEERLDVEKTLQQRNVSKERVSSTYMSKSDIAEHIGSLVDKILFEHKQELIDATLELLKQNKENKEIEQKNRQLEKSTKEKELTSSLKIGDRVQFTVSRRNKDYPLKRINGFVAYINKGLCRVLTEHGTFHKRINAVEVI